MNFLTLNLGQLLHLLDNELKNIINFEKQKKQFISAQYGILFHQTCLNEELYSAYSNFKLHDPEARHERFSIKYKET